MSLTCHFPFAGLFGGVAGRCGFLRSVTRPSSQALWRANGILAAPFLLTGYNHRWLPCTLGTLGYHHRDHVIPPRGPILSILQSREQHLHPNCGYQYCTWACWGQCSQWEQRHPVLAQFPVVACAPAALLPVCCQNTHWKEPSVRSLVLFCHSASLICSPFYCRIILLT